MEYRQLGRTGTRVSKLCLGTMNFVVSTELEEAKRIVDEAVDSGINFIDTATGLPITPNGGDIIVTWDNGANKIFKL